MAKPKQPKPDARIEEIMDVFDFRMVQRAMMLLNWTWGVTKSPDDFPTIREIRKEARKLLNRIVQEKHLMQTRFGGLIAEKDSNGVVELRFELEMAQGFPPHYSQEE